jgi:formylmethanofuran dehydrogenase subunit E
VRDDVYATQNDLVEMLLEKKIISTEDITNLQVTYEFDTLEEARETIIDEFGEKRWREWMKDWYVAEEEEEAGTLEWLSQKATEEANNREVYQWWHVSDWLIEHLRIQQEPLIECEWGTWWGRTQCGQQLASDDVFEKIVRRLHE